MKHGRKDLDGNTHFKQANLLSHLGNGISQVPFSVHCMKFLTETIL